MVIFSVIFGRIAQMPSDGIPYPVFSYAALVPWMFFANSVTKASNSLVGNAGIVTRIYFPRLAMPLSAILGNTVDFVLAFLMLLALMVYFGVTPTANVVWLPLLLVLAFATALGVSLVLAAMNVQFRDVGHAVPFALQLGDVRDACGVSREPHQGSSLAVRIRAQPDGGCGRGLPMGAPRN
jgi:lipopolysaccharide transport system permease protein